jgi:hypothetical protein
MKKPAVKRKKAGRKANGARQPPLRALLSGLDADQLRRFLLEDVLTAERSIEDMVRTFLDADPTEPEDFPEVEAMSELSEELDRLRVDANGGDSEAREALTRVREMIAKAASRDRIHPAVLMFLGRAFAGSHVDIGDAARASMGRIVEAGLLHDPEEAAYRELVQPLLNDLVGDDFDLHEEVRSLFAIFPESYRSRMVEAFVADSADRARRSAVGFLLDPADSTALAAIRGLSASAERGELDDVARRRIALIRPWLCSARREALDRAFPPAAAVRKRSVAEVVKTVASACDGSGAASLIATVKQGTRFHVVALMTKPSGLVDSTMMGKISKTEAAQVETSASGVVSSAYAPVETWLRLVRLALGRNLAEGEPPPFEFVRAAEALGLDSLVPDLSSSADIIDSLLAGVAERDDPAAVAEAQESVLDLDAVDGWFEAGREVETVLRPTKTIADGAEALLDAYLPGRRLFWARQCALTALALSAGSPPEASRNLALVGRELLGEAPLPEIPLMRQIAETSAISFFAYRK